MFLLMFQTSVGKDPPHAHKQFYLTISPHILPIRKLPHLPYVEKSLPLLLFISQFTQGKSNHLFRANPSNKPCQIPFIWHFINTSASQAEVNKTFISHSFALSLQLIGTIQLRMKRFLHFFGRVSSPCLLFTPEERIMLRRGNQLCFPRQCKRNRNTTLLLGWITSCHLDLESPICRWGLEVSPNYS